MHSDRDDRTTESLRHRIDGGGAGDKVTGSDPAAAPLGTDEEAGGHPPSGVEIAAAWRHEPGQVETDPSRTNGRVNGVGRFVFLTAAIALALITALAWALAA
ncbi:hypothetical protein FHS85_001546 [Rhodoligotrophos appendicifer]|uniref:hypothetical protein n=1 Tax=Rhodoligotrophos appendicifer TaxID=987056 RepID=UPI001185B892|nr:hypothetical protein [Rhodoligotrophos appendicifer]